MNYKEYDEFNLIVPARDMIEFQNDKKLKNDFYAELVELKKTLPLLDMLSTKSFSNVEEIDTIISDSNEDNYLGDRLGSKLVFVSNIIKDAKLFTLSIDSLSEKEVDHLQSLDMYRKVNDKLYMYVHAVEGNIVLLSINRITS